MTASLHRPLVFGKVPSIMLYRDHVAQFLRYLSSRQVQFEAFRFQQNFHLVRFPELRGEDVEHLLDECDSMVEHR